MVTTVTTKEAPMTESSADKFEAYSSLIEYLFRGGATVDFVGNHIKALNNLDGRIYSDTAIEDMVQGDYEALLGKKSRPIQHEMEVFVTTETSGSFTLRDCYDALHLKNKDEQVSCRVALSRLVKQGIIERSGKKTGLYRKLDRKVEIMDWQHAPTDDFEIALPLGIPRLCKLYPANIAVVAGTSNAGKTAFLLNIVKLNMARYKIYYFNSEMGETELRLRLSLFDDVPLDSWKFFPIERATDFPDVITQEKAIFIIDFFEVWKDFYEVSGVLSAIQQKLKHGVCFIALQKKSGSDVGRGGEGTLEKARLYLSMDHDPESNIIKIVKAKAWRNHDRNPNGMSRRYSLAQGSKLIAKGEWN
jgi:hypothetical protein